MPRTLLPLALILCLLQPTTRAEDWPQWRGPTRTGHVSPNTSVPTTLPPAPPILWRVPLGDGVASPVVANNRVFCLDNQQGKETVHAYDAATGKPLWSAPLDLVHKDSQTPAGPRCTPLVDEDRLYAQSCRGQLTCFSVADGKPIWQTNYVKDFGATYIGEKGRAEGATRHGYDGSPLIDGDHLIAEVGGKPNGAVVCFDKRTGKVIWKSGDQTPAYAAPIIATVAGRRQFIAFMAEGVIALDPTDGKRLWHVPVKTALGRHVTTPTVAGDIVMVASFQAGLIGIKVTQDGDNLKADRAWTSKDSAINFSSPVVVANHLYGLGPNKNLICVDTTTGKQTWSKEGYFTHDGGHSHAGLIVMDKNILALTDSGQLLLFAADPKECHEVARTQISGQTWCNPAYANGNLYLRDSKELLCLRLLP